MGRAERLADAEQHAMIDPIFEENSLMNEVYPGDTYLYPRGLCYCGGEH